MLITHGWACQEKLQTFTEFSISYFQELAQNLLRKSTRFYSGEEISIPLHTFGQAGPRQPQMGVQDSCRLDPGLGSRPFRDPQDPTVCLCLLAS